MTRTKRTRCIEVTVDLTDVPRRLAHVSVDMPVQGGTTAALTTPLWMCESHLASGPVARIAGLFFAAVNGPGVATTPETLTWRRDVPAGHIYLVDVPHGVDLVRISFDAILKGWLTSRMLMFPWETVIFHPARVDVARLPVRASILFPVDWECTGTLAEDRSSVMHDKDGRTRKVVTFQIVSVERLVDSPLLLGKHMSRVHLTPDGAIQVCATFSKPELARIPQDRVNKLAKMVEEAAAVFGPPPYQQYKFLAASSDLLLSQDSGYGGGGIEHAQSTTLLTTSSIFANEDQFEWYGALFSHEYTHVWNGKYRRPLGHVPNDYSTPLDGTLLWVYEGLTEYYGNVLAVRAGMSTVSGFRTRLAINAADMQRQSGRIWRSTEDTARGMAIMRAGIGAGWASWLRDTQDYYTEGTLLWLDADTLIRERSNGQKSLDDFSCRFFDARGATEPLVVPYTLAEVIETLNDTLAYDWAAFIRERVQTPQAQANTTGIERAGYKVVYTETPYHSPSPEVDKMNALWHSMGLRVGKDGTVADVQRHSLADKAGMAPTQTITHVGGKKFSLNQMATQIALTRGKPQGCGVLKVSIKHDEETFDVDIEHSGGLVYPSLERCEAGTDLLAAILAPRVPRQ